MFRERGAGAFRALINPTFLWLWLQQLVVQLLLQSHTEEGDHSLSYWG